MGSGTVAGTAADLVKASACNTVSSSTVACGFMSGWGEGPGLTAGLEAGAGLVTGFGATSGERIDSGALLALA